MKLGTCRNVGSGWLSVEEVYALSEAVVVVAKGELGFGRIPKPPIADIVNANCFAQMMEELTSWMIKRGITAVIANGFTREFTRTAVNFGLQVIQAPVDGIATGQEISADFEQGYLYVDGQAIAITAHLSVTQQKIVAAGGLANYCQQGGELAGEPDRSASRAAIVY